MKVTSGARGARCPRRGPETTRYGGNTSCLQVTLSDGTMLVLDAGTGIRNLGLMLAGAESRLNILLTHLHLDHIQGLMFFAPVLPTAVGDRGLGPGLAGGVAAGPHRALHLGAAVAGRGARAAVLGLVPGGARDRVGDRAGAGSAPPRSPTAGRRSATGSPTATTSSATSPTTSRRSGTDLSRAATRSGSPATTWRSGASLLIHDCQYSDDEYPDHLGWGHCGAGRRAHVRAARRGRAPAAVPPRPAALRRPPGRVRGRRRPCAGSSWAVSRRRWRWRSSAGSCRSAPGCRSGRPDPRREATRPRRPTRPRASPPCRPRGGRRPSSRTCRSRAPAPPSSPRRPR